MIQPRAEFLGYAPGKQMTEDECTEALEEVGWLCEQCLLFGRVYTNAANAIDRPSDFYQRCKEGYVALAKHYRQGYEDSLEAVDYYTDRRKNFELYNEWEAAQCQTPQ